MESNADRHETRSGSSPEVVIICYAHIRFPATCKGFVDSGHHAFTARSRGTGLMRETWEDLHPKAYTSFKLLAREQFFMRVKSETHRTTLIQDARLA